MNDEAVYRTAPATPGLLKIAFFASFSHLKIIPLLKDIFIYVPFCAIKPCI